MTAELQPDKSGRAALVRMRRTIPWSGRSRQWGGRLGLSLRSLWCRGRRMVSRPTWVISGSEAGCFPSASAGLGVGPGTSDEVSAVGMVTGQQGAWLEMERTRSPSRTGRVSPGSRALPHPGLGATSVPAGLLLASGSGSEPFAPGGGRQGGLDSTHLRLRGARHVR